jgi:hypothetical protein
MAIIADGIKTVAAYTVLGINGIIVGAAVSAVSVIAVPLFALKALPQWIEHRSLYARTLTNGSRAKFGRVEGQDYTRWDGKTVTQNKKDLTQKEKMHESIGSYVHGNRSYSFLKDSSKQATDNPFHSQDDLNWLNLEFTRREKKDLLDRDLKILRAFCKAVIPVFGMIWVIFSETNIGGASEFGCRVCRMSGDSEDLHWDWKEAVEFHQNTILNKRSVS